MKMPHLNLFKDDEKKDDACMREPCLRAFINEWANWQLNIINGDRYLGIQERMKIRHGKGGREGDLKKIVEGIKDALNWFENRIFYF